MNFEISPKETEIQAMLDEARLYCFSLDVDGVVGWRLPNQDELNEIYQSDNDFEKDWYWSSTEINGYNGRRQYVNGGTQHGGNKNYGVYYVRAIRSI